MIANAEKNTIDKVRELENQIVMLGSILEWIGALCNGKDVSDFALSFNSVNEVSDALHTQYMKGIEDGIRQVRGTKES